MIWFVAVLMSVIGFVAAGLALLLAIRGEEVLAWLRSRPGLNALSILAGGCLLMLGGQYKLARMLDYRALLAAQQVEAYARMHVALQGPLDFLHLTFVGAGPFQEQPEARKLRLYFRDKTGLAFVSEVGPHQLKALGPPRRGQPISPALAVRHRRGDGHGRPDRRHPRRHRQ
jgi:hypothetical protein